MAYEFKRDTTPCAYTFDGRPVIGVPQGMTSEEALLWANGITRPEQLKGLNSGSFGLSEPIHYGYGHAFYGQDEGPEIGKSKIRK